MVFKVFDIKIRTLQYKARLGSGVRFVGPTGPKIKILKARARPGSARVLFTPQATLVPLILGES